MRSPAFTLIELLIVTLIIALLSGGFMISYTNLREKAVFDDDQSKTISIIQKARDLSLTNLQVNDLETDYYRLEVKTDGITLTGYDIDGGTRSIGSVTFSTGITSDTEFYADYSPPYGTITLSTGGQSQDFTIADSNGNTSTVSIGIFGGFPEAS